MSDRKSHTDPKPPQASALIEEARHRYRTRDPGADTAPLIKLQLELMKVTYRRSALHSEWIALAIIEQLGITFGTDDAEKAVEALGMILVHSGVLAAMHYMAIDPLIGLGMAYRVTGEVQPVQAPAALAAAVRPLSMFDRDRTPGESYADDQTAIAHGIALAIAKGLDDVEICHEVTINAVELFGVMAKEVLGPRVVVEVPPEPTRVLFDPTAFASKLAQSVVPVASGLESKPKLTLAECVDALMQPAAAPVADLSFTGIDRSATTERLVSPPRVIDLECLEQAAVAASALPPPPPIERPPVLGSGRKRK